MTGKYLDFHYRSLEKGQMDILGVGLCSEFNDDALFKLLTPTEEDGNDLWDAGLDIVYWGSGSLRNDTNYRNKLVGYTPLRQTIVLLMAAINDEL